ncbi:hypothetical protein D3C71_1911560 [compost metagenome]
MLHAFRHDFSGSLSAQCSYLLLQITDAGFTSVLANRSKDRIIAYFKLLLLKPVLPLLLRQQITSSDLQLLQFRITRNIQHFHTVKERPGNVVHRIRGRNEHDIR